MSNLSDPVVSTNQAPDAAENRSKKQPALFENLWLQISFVTIIYIVLALLGSLLSLHDVEAYDVYALSIWPAAGMAFAALLLCGNRCWPGIWLGAFIADVILQPPSAGIVLAAIIATGVTLQAILGAALTRQLFASELPLSREKDILGFLILAGPLACLVSASFGIPALYGLGSLALDEVISHWLIWWISNTLGVLIFAPVILIIWPGAKSICRGNGIFVVLPLFITAILLVAGNMGFLYLEQSQAREQADKLMADPHISGFHSLPDVIEPLRGMERFFSASENVTRDEFASYATYFSRHPAIVSVDWAPRLANKDVHEFESALKMEGLIQHQLFELDSAGMPVPIAKDDVYFPVLYTEPFEHNQSVVGLDHNFEHPRRLAMVTAQETGELSATPVIPLLRTDIQAVLAFMPVYKNGYIPSELSLEQRPETLRGFIVGVVDITKLLAPLVRIGEERQLGYRLTDITPGMSHQLITTTLPANLSPEWEWEESFANRTWLLEMQPLEDYWHPWTSIGSRMYLGFSMLAAFLVAFAALSAAGRQAATLLEVKNRTAELRQELYTRRIIEKALRDSEQDLEITLHSIGDAVLATDGNRCITLMNPIAEQLTGWSLYEAKGRPIEDVFNIINEKTRQPSLIPVDDVLRTGEVHGLANHTVLISKDGTEYHIADSAAPIRDHDNKDVIRGVVLIFRDVGEEREITRQLEQAREDAEQASQAKSLFLATMSHEIRTPMNGVLGLVDVLSHSNLSVHQVDLVSTIRQSATTLLAIIDDILDFSKIEAGKLEIEYAPVSILDLVEGLCNSLVPIASQKGVDLALFISPEVPDRVLADDVRLRQILYNLIGNAIKFSNADAIKRGRVSIRVTLAHKSPLQLAISISDNGIGMAPETINALFNPFTQAEASTTRRFGGSGLGLTICKRLVESMQGDIAVESKPDEGSTFTLTLPFDVAEQEVTHPQLDLSGLNCIVVQNAGFNADDIQIYLEYAGASIKQVADIESVANVIPGLIMPVVVIQYTGHEKLLMNPALDALGDVRHLLITRGRRRRARVETPTVVSLDGNALRRQALIRAVAVAAGRASPEIFQQTAEFKLPEDVMQVPTVDEARTQGHLILVAEDDDINQKVILQQLALLGYAGEVANNGTEALQMWRQGNYGLLLTDLHMPEMDGYTLASKIREEEAGRKRIPVIALTANVLHGEINNVRSAGMDDYMTKPVQLKLLKSALEKWLPDTGYQTAARPVNSNSAIASSDELLDINVLKNMVGDDPVILNDFLKSYVDSLNQYANEINDAFITGEIKKIASVAHKLKSSSYAVGAQTMGDSCKELEDAGKVADKVSVSNVIARFEFIRTELVTEIMQLLKQY
ncbi:MAG: ATP-binding protein [Gammaproteobacteria bacterium]|nr:ATP-binding protein [Gammaproteobacteria bacterium]